ncbi:MAG: hypothetical protein DME70_00170 [Verrucomicrobia bacterium]|nr:MAG: hypothetical protein DME70_00170 [Verrucomicrobiota bacterium]
MQNPQHTGFLNVVGQNLNKILANIVYDPLVPDEQAHNGGDLLAHYQVPLVEGNDVYMESKAGSYTVGTYATQTWHQNKFTWQGKNLVKVATGCPRADKRISGNRFTTRSWRTDISTIRVSVDRFSK